MKKIIGIILLVLALISTVNLVIKLSQSGTAPRTRNAAYESGRKAGMFLAPVLLGGLGLWLVLSSGGPRRVPPPIRQSSSGGVQPAKPWFKTVPAIIGFSVAGTLVCLFVLMIGLGAVLRASKRSPRISAPPPQTRAPVLPKPPGHGELTESGPYKVGGSVEANWAGKWTPGKITRINPGGFSMMVQLEDARWPHPIVVSTNQLRVKP